MGCVVNGPGEAEGADVAVFAGKGRGIIYVQGEQVRTVTEEQMLDALYEESLKFAARVERGEAHSHQRPSQHQTPRPHRPARLRLRQDQIRPHIAGHGRLMSRDASGSESDKKVQIAGCCDSNQ